MKLKFTTSLLLLSLYCFGQEDVRRDYSTEKPKKEDSIIDFEIGFDVFAAARFYATIDDIKKKRLSFFFRKPIKNNLFAELQIGKSKIFCSNVNNVLYNISNEGIYIQPSIGFNLDLKHLINISFGIIYHRYQETGTIRIGGEYFSPYEERFSNEGISVRPVVGMGFKLPIGKHFFLRLNQKFCFGWPESSHEQANLNFLPGGNYAPNTTGFEITSFIHLNFGYKF